MNWGLKIVIGLGAFMIFIVAAGVYMVSHDSDSLVDNDYYEKSLTYDEVYVSKENLEKDGAKPTIKVRNDTLYIHFVHADNQGELQFKRPSDGKLDVTLPFATKTNDFQLPVSTFTKGSWDLDVNWKSNSKTYLSSHPLFL
ncbi:FixH family protein [Sphingobacterium psychroaquaticum]|uniref:FixH protein n=1 Tax=Sphingobacterium psychroaquaticum TaxID=561061 RepID=A0A1X7I0N9_9SPHI|nr:FixH family protein [Sphingobacterium psychroaquaticum]QBQ42200.1 hypothetical protein E2P86_14005 [Sphingobacterium psychroaquaticum]SMG07446.1 FixH protein [Sphingobacterium psychroaquaticum]